MRTWLIIGLLAAFSVGAQAAEPKLAKPVNLEKVGKAIRDGKLYVGKTYAMPEKSRFHNIHDVGLGLPCNGCHNVAGYPDDYLFLRKAEFPLHVDGEDVGAVHRSKCLACHSEGGAGRAFYNVTKK
jgi:cytochrome c